MSDGEVRLRDELVVLEAQAALARDALPKADEITYRIDFILPERTIRTTLRVHMHNVS